MQESESPPWQRLCRLEDIPDGLARGFGRLEGWSHPIFVVRRGDRVFCYLNWCPHAGAELEFAKDRFLSRDGQRIICFAHNAQFTVETGICIAGPCGGESLLAVPLKIEVGEIFIRLRDTHA